MAQQTLHFGLKINADTSDARAELDRLKQVLGQLGTGTGFKFNAKQEIREASIAAQQLQKHLAAATNKTGDFDINRFTASIKKGEMSLSEMSMKLMQIGPEGTNAFRTLSTQILNAQKPALSFSNILTKMGTTLANNIRWQLSSAAINAVTGSIQEAWHYTKEMDKALTNIRVVTGKSREEMDSLAKSANKMAKELRSTTQEIVKGQLIFYQQGDSAAQAAEKARITTMAANVSFNSSQEEMADYLTAIWNSYQVGSSELELFVDKLAAVGASTATSMEEIATGMQKVAASANAVGVTYDQLNATIATISSTTRTSAEQVGTAMKTIYARMGDLKAGKTDEDGITYGQVSTQIKKLGFDIADANGQLRDMGEVVEEIGNKWHTLSDETQQALAQAIAGKRQYTNLFALFDNWDMYLDTLETSKNAMGALQKQQDAWADSIEGASNRVKSSLETLYSQVINDEAIIDMVNGFASLLEYFTGLIDALGGLGTILPAIGGLLVSAFAPAIVSGLTSGMMNLRTLFGGWIIDLKKSRDGLIEMANAPGFDRLSAEQQKLILNTRDLAIAQNEYVKNSKHMTAQQKQEAQFAMDTAQALQVTITELETTAQAYKDAALASKNFSTAGGANVQNLNAGSATMAFRKAFDTVNSNQGFFSPALKKQLDDIQTKIQSGVTPSLTELKNAIISYNAEVNNLNSGGGTANIEKMGKAFDKLMIKMSKVQAQMEGYQVLAKNLNAKPGGGFTFDTKDITVTTQIRQALKDVGIEASKIEQILKDGVIPDGVLGPDITDVKSLESAASKAEKTLNRFAKLGNKKFGSPVEELKKSAKVTRDHALANEDYVASLEKAKGAAKVFGTGLTTAIGGVTSLTFSLQSLKSAGDAIASGDWLTGISSGLMGLTMAGSGVKSIADGIIAMHGEGGAAIKGLAQAMNGMGLTFQKTGSLVTDSAMSATTAWVSVLGPVLAVAAALAALGTVIYLVAKDMKKAETNAKSAAEQAKTFSDELDNANQELTDLKNNFENYNTKQSALDKMTEGTDEFKKALQEANEEVIDLITKYPELAEYVNDVNGRLVVSVEGQNKLLKAQQAEIDRAYANKLSSNIVAISAKQEADEQALATKVLGSKASNVGETITGGVVGGVATAGTIAALGATIGSAVPVIGTIVGGILGAAVGVAVGHFASGAKDFKEHGLDKFTHAVETQGINIMSSYKSLENALGGDSELAQALWNNKEETSKLAKEIAANKKQIELNTKQLIKTANPEVESSPFKNDIYGEGTILAKNRERSQIYADHMIELLNDGSEQDAVDEYLKTMYGDEAHKYRIVDRFGTNSTLQKLEDGEWVTVGGKSGLSDDTMIENYRNKKAVNLSEKEISQITEKSIELRAKILANSKDETVQAIIAQYGTDAKSAIEAISKSGKGFIEVYRETLKEEFDYSATSWQKMIDFELQYNTAFEGLSEAVVKKDEEALKNYLTLFQQLGFFIGEDISIFDKFNVQTGRFLDTTVYTEAALRKIEKIREKRKSNNAESEFISGFMDLEGVKEKRTDSGDMEIVEGEEIVRTYLSSYFPPELIDQVMKDYLQGMDLGEIFNKYITKGIESDIEDIIMNDPTAAFRLSTDATEWENNYGVSAEKAQEFAQAVIDLQNVQGAELKLNEKGQLVLEKNGEQYDANSMSALGWEAAINKTILSAKNFKNIGTELYNNIVSVGMAYGWTKGQTNSFLTALNSLNGANPDLSGFIDQCAIAGGAAMAALNSVLALHNVTVSREVTPDGVVRLKVVDGENTTYYKMGDSFKGNETAFTAAVYKKIIAKKGISPKDLYADYSGQWKELFGNFTTNTGGITGPGGTGKKDPQWKKDYEKAIKQAEYDAEVEGWSAQQLYEKRLEAFKTALNAAKISGEYEKYKEDFLGWAKDLRDSSQDILDEAQKDWDLQIKNHNLSFADTEILLNNELGRTTIDTEGNIVDVYNAKQKKEIKREFYEGWDKFFNSIEARQERGELGKAQSIFEMWNIANDSDFDEEQRKQMAEKIRSYGLKLVESLPDDLKNGAISWKDAIKEFGDTVTNTWGIVLKDMTREEFLKLPLEQRQALENSASGLMSSIEEMWGLNQIDFNEGLKRRDELLNSYGMIFSETDKTKFLNNEKFTEKYISAQQKLYEDGAIDAKRFRDNLLSAATAFPEHAYKVTSAIRQQIQQDIDEIFNMLESQDFGKSLSNTINTIKKELASQGILEGSDEWNKGILYALSKAAPTDIAAIQAAYNNIIAQQDFADWGMTENANNAAEYKMPFAKKQLEDLIISFEYFKENYTGTDILNDKQYQAYITAISNAREEVMKLNEESLQFSKDWIAHEKAMGRLTSADETAAYQRIRKNLDEQFDKLLKDPFINAEDAIEWYKKQSAELRQAEIDARKAEADQYAEILKEKLEDEKAYYESLKSIREKSFDASQTIRESQYELNLELQKSLTMYEYLDEETRKLIFNTEDYAALSNKLVEIQEEINALTVEYEKDLLGASAEEAELLTAEYEAQVELKLKEFEIAKANLEIAKKQMALQNILNERNTRMFINGQWTWVANQENVVKAREELAKAEFDAETATLEYEHKQAMNQLDDSINDVQREVNKIDKALEDLEKVINGTDGLTVTLEDLDKVVEDTIKYIKNSKNADKVAKIGDDYLTKSEWNAVQKEAKSVSNSKNQINPVTGKPYVTDKLGYAIVNGIRVKLNAEGDIVNRPTISMVGEDGPEAIIPLSQKYRDRGLSLWEEATKALGIAPSFTMPIIRASFPQQKENMNVSQTINVTVQNEDSSNDFYAITNLL